MSKSNAERQAEWRARQKNPDPESVGLQGWALITYLHTYLQDKRPEQLAALADREQGQAVVCTLSEFFQAACAGTF